MKKFLVILFLFVFLFSSCATTGGGGLGGLFKSGGDVPKEVSRGDGLEIDFRLDDGWITRGMLRYELTLSNSGRDPITIDRGNFELDTRENLVIFASGAVEDFYDQVLGDGITLYNGQEIKKSGSLELDNSFLRESILPDFTYILTVDYDYTTEFSSQVEIDPKMEQNNNPLRVRGGISQAAPVKVSDIEMEPYRDNAFILLYYFKDEGDNGNTKTTSVEIDDFDVKLGSDSLSCEPYYKGSDGYYTKSNRFLINEKNGQLLARCFVNLDLDSGVYQTTTGGDFSYNYNIVIEDKITLPENREGVSSQREELFA